MDGGVGSGGGGDGARFPRARAPGCSVDCARGARVDAADALALRVLCPRLRRPAAAWSAIGARGCGGVRHIPAGDTARAQMSPSLVYHLLKVPEKRIVGPGGAVLNPRPVEAPARKSVEQAPLYTPAYVQRLQATVEETIAHSRELLARLKDQRQRVDDMADELLRDDGTFAPPAEPACTDERAACIACYGEHIGNSSVLKCAPQVKAFSECALRVQEEFLRAHTPAAAPAAAAQ